MSRLPSKNNSPTRDKYFMNDSHDFWKEKLNKESQYVPLTELQSLRMLGHNGQAYFGVSKRQRMMPLRENSGLDYYKERMDYFADQLQKRQNPYSSLEAKLEQTNSRYRESHKERQMDNLQWRQEQQLKRSRLNQSDMKDYMQLNPERDYSPVEARYLTLKNQNYVKPPQSNYRQFARNRQILMETNQDAFKKMNEQQLPQILTRNQPKTLPQQSSFPAQSRYQQEPEISLNKGGSGDIFTKVNKKVARPVDEMFSVLQPSFQSIHDERNYAYKMQNQRYDTLKKHDSYNSNQFPSSMSNGVSRRASQDLKYANTQLNSKRFSSLGFNYQGE